MFLNLGEHASARHMLDFCANAGRIASCNLCISLPALPSSTSVHSHFWGFSNKLIFSFLSLSLYIYISLSLSLFSLPVSLCSPVSLSLSLRALPYIYIYIHTYMCMCFSLSLYIYIYIYIFCFFFLSLSLSLSLSPPEGQPILGPFIGAPLAALAPNQIGRNPHMKFEKKRRGSKTLPQPLSQSMMFRFSKPLKYQQHLLPSESWRGI